MDSLPVTSAPADAKRVFIDSLPDELDPHIRSSSNPEWGQMPTFDPIAVEYLATEMQVFLASVVAELIDAGSERDAINEDEDLHQALVTLLKGW